MRSHKFMVNLRSEKNQKGVILVFSILFFAVILSTTLALSSVFIPRIRFYAGVRNSTAALYAADSGLEWCLYIVKKGASINPPILSNGAQFLINKKSSPLPSDCVSPIQAVGTQVESTRALEVSF